MTESDIKGLVAANPFSFVGTVEHLGAATSGDLPIDDHTAVLRVEIVLHAPPAFVGLEGQRITVQLLTDVDLPAVGEEIALFAEGLAFGEGIAVLEVARVPVESVAPHANLAFDAGEERAFAPLEREVAADAMRAHVDGADAVVVGLVVALEQAAETGYSEHDPLWWRATIDVRQVVRGDLQPGKLGVLYPNSLDLQWRRVPKPKASQDGVWILHATGEDLAELGAYRLLHEDDRQTVDALPEITGEER
jgi:hypothetical protein